MDSMVGRKHHQDMDDGMGLSMNHGGGTSSRKHKKRKTTRGDIDVGVMSTSHLHSDASDDDDDHSSQASSSSSSSELEYIDPSLQPSRSMTSHPGLNIRSPPPDFATNTGHFRSLPLSSSNSAPAFNHHSQEENDGPSSKLSSNDYTHISQAIAHQPLAINPSQQTVDLMKKLAQASLGREQGSDADRVAHFMAEVTAQMYSVSQRIDVLETGRFVSLSSIATLQTSLAKVEAELRHSDPHHIPSTSVHPQAPTHHLLAHHLDQSSSAGLPSGDGSPPGSNPSTSSNNPISDAVNIANAEQFQAMLYNQFAVTSSQFLDAGGPSNSLLHSHLNDHSSNLHASTSKLPASPPKGGDGDNSRLPKLKKATTTPKAPLLKRKKGRKPELSRAVRSTMFRMLGLSLASHTAKYHGYSTSPDLPVFSTAVQFDPNTGMRVWRWDWDKTIRQSAYNAAFSMAIQNQVLLEKGTGMHSDVPSSDWTSLDEAVDSAYTNLRRERESQLDPVKKMKKDAHRSKGKKKGIKDEKCKRRKLAFKDSKIRGIVDADRLMLEDVDVEAEINAIEDDESEGEEGDEDGEDGGKKWRNILASFTGNSMLELNGDTGGSNDQKPDERLEDALDPRYMSSEEELDTENPEVLARTDIVDIASVALLTTSTSTSLELASLSTTTNEPIMKCSKVSSVHPPIWRTARLGKVFAQLDLIRPPEIVVRRIKGAKREFSIPPTSVKDWMLDREWVKKTQGAEVEEGSKAVKGKIIKKGKGNGKGKEKEPVEKDLETGAMSTQY